MSHVVHVDFVAFAPTASGEALEGVLKAASTLAGEGGARSVLAIDADEASDFDLALFFVVDGVPGLEAFGTDPRYAAFLQKTLAPCLGSLAGADVLAEGEAGQGERAACLALIAPPHAYDWEVRAALRQWSGESGLVGLAFGERQRFRGLALVRREALPARPALASFGVTLVQGRALPLA